MPVITREALEWFQEELETVTAQRDELGTGKWGAGLHLSFTRAGESQPAPVLAREYNSRARGNGDNSCR